MTMKYHTVVTAPPAGVACRCVAIVVHGAAEHSGRYATVLRALAEQGVATVSGDLPGHGRSPGRRGDIDHFDHYLDAAEHFLEIGRQRFGDQLPLVLFGHSMGGLICALLAARQAQAPESGTRDAASAPPSPKADGLVLTSPSFATAIRISRSRLWLAKSLLPFMPRLYQSNQIQAINLTRSAAVIAAHGDDRLISRQITLRWYFAFRDAMARALPAAAQITIPTAVFQAGADRIVDVAATRAWFERLASPVKSYREYPEMYHELLNEPEADEVLRDILAWLRAAFPADWTRAPRTPREAAP